MALQQLFTPGKINQLELKNRVVFPAMGTKMCEPGGYVSQRLIDYHVARVKGGCGLNIIEVSYIHPMARMDNALAIYSDKFVPGMQKLATAIREAGGKSCLQLWHCGKMAAVPEPVSSSPIPFMGTPLTPRELTIPEIQEIVQAYADAAGRAQTAGFDAVEFHAGHGYLPQQFLSPYMNKRTDEYGGAWENRCRFGLECIRAIRAKVGPDFPILMRISVLEDVPGGLTVEDMMSFCQLAEQAGIDAIDVSRGLPEGAAIKFEVPPVDLPIGFNVENASRVKSVVNIPVIVAGRINDPEYADGIIQEGKVDFVVMGRAQLADAEMCNKAERGDLDQIVKCIGCDQGCFDAYVNPYIPFISCMRNPSTGREVEYSLKATETPKKVLIAGGGPAGLEAATTLKRRGHNPILCEKSATLGGQFYLAGAAPRKKEMAEAAVQMGRIARQEGVDIRLNTEVTPELIDSIQPDEVILAVGSTPIVPPIPGVDGDNVILAQEVLWGHTGPKGNLIVIGGGLVGLETAELLAEQRQQVTIVEMLPEVGSDLGWLRKIPVFEHLYGSGVQMLTSSKCVQINAGGVIIEKDGQQQEIPADCVILAVGSKSLDSENLSAHCKAGGIPFHVIGDALKARKAIDAIWEAAELAREV
ncbi:MAG: NAD(P)/FAD-dependent oxidoreductase [Anaerolineaceae bacterium]|nr:NAD(P)/FAD-dependent oxidoreductase [Anaerolineaceae bacterium]